MSETPRITVTPVETRYGTEYEITRDKRSFRPKKVARFTAEEVDLWEAIAEALPAEYDVTYDLKAERSFAGRGPYKVWHRTEAWSENVFEPERIVTAALRHAAQPKKAPAEAAPAAPARALPPVDSPEVTEAANLIAQKMRNGDHTGFLDLRSFITPEGNINMALLRAASREDMAMILDNFRGDY